MLSSYDFCAPSRIVFGWGRRAEIGPLVSSLSDRAFVVCGSRTLERTGQLAGMLDAVRSHGVSCEHVATISREPEVADVDELVAKLLARGAGSRPAGHRDCVIGIGGGSALDLAKAVAALVTNRRSSTVKDYLEGVGAGLTIDSPPLPMLAIPTTSGTGTEATRNAVISSYEPAFKKSLRSPLMVPDCVLIDPELTVGLPPEITAFTGMDAITQLIESWLSCRSRPIPDALCLQGLELAIPALATCVRRGDDAAARTAMSHAALLSGMALGNSGLGMAHGVAAALGVHARVPHGLACALMLPATLRTNLSVAAERIAVIGRVMRGAIQRCPDVADELRELALDSDRSGTRDDAQFAIAVIGTLCRIVGIPDRLSAVGVRAEQIPAIAASSRGNSMSGNPRTLTDDELTGILSSLL